jgi:hypothetical protein
MKAMKRPIRSVLMVAVAFSLLTLAAPALADRSIIRQPGQHPNYVFEAEPHGILSFWGVPGPGNGSGVGVGFRGSVVIVDNGFVKTINNSVAISFGLDWVHYEVDDWCGYWNPPGPGGNQGICYWDDDANLIWLPVAMQWNFWLSENWSVFGEPGLAIRINDDHYDDDLDLDFVFYGGGRFHFSDAVSLTMRLGFPTSLSVGVSFFL